MDSQGLRDWNQAFPIGTAVTAKFSAGSNDQQPTAYNTKTRTTAYFLNDGTPVVMVTGISTAVPLTDIEKAAAEPKFPVQLTTYAFDEEHANAIRRAVAAINAENVDLHIERDEQEGDGSYWITISSATPNRLFHLGARVGKWLAEEKMEGQAS